jgi:hypothetical protein
LTAHRQEVQLAVGFQFFGPGDRAMLHGPFGSHRLVLWISRRIVTLPQGGHELAIAGQPVGPEAHEREDCQRADQKITKGVW